MWKASIGTSNATTENDENDDWETDPDFINDVSEEEQRWGSKTIEGSGRTAGTIDMQQLREETAKSDAKKKQKQLEELNTGYGYGGKYGIQTDRMDKSAMGHDYIGKVEKHASQKDYSAGFGGKYGVQSDRVDKSAVGWDHLEKVEKHDSQKDHSKGFGGKFGVQSDRVDKSALGWDHIEKVEKHNSQIDHKIGFGGKFGIQSDRMDKSAVGFTEQKEKIGTNYTKVKPDIAGAKPSNLRARFENLAKETEEENKRKAEEQKRLRQEKDKKDRDQAAERKETETIGQSDSNLINRKPLHVATGREGGIGTAINAFNQIATTPVDEQPKKTSVKVTRETSRETEFQEIQPQQPPPDVVPEVEPEVEPVLVSNPMIDNSVVEPPIEYSKGENKSVLKEEPIYQNQEDLSELIEDTGVKAIALYDYQAAAEDEISFDPNDIISHIEMLCGAKYREEANDKVEKQRKVIEQTIDEGWWRGLCKNRYGLFPANYVQLLDQQQTC